MKIVSACKLNSGDFGVLVVIVAPKAGFQCLFECWLFWGRAIGCILVVFNAHQGNNGVLKANSYMFQLVNYIPVILVQEWSL